MINIYRLKKKHVPYGLRCLIGDYIRHTLYQLEIDKPLSLEWMGYYWHKMDFIIAVEDTKIIGYLSYVMQETEECMVHTAYVDSSYRGKGVFKKMYSSLRRAMTGKVFVISSTISSHAEHKNQTTFNRSVLSTNVRDYL